MWPPSMNGERKAPQADSGVSDYCASRCQLRRTTSCSLPGAAPKRFARYGLTLHPATTRFVDFRNNRSNGTDHPETDGTSFTFLGFTHVWGRSRAGNKVVRQVTAKNRYARALAAVTAWCRLNRHQSIPDQHAQAIEGHSGCGPAADIVPAIRGVERSENPSIAADTA
jgi:hypothetical protein